MLDVHSIQARAQREMPNFAWRCTWNNIDDEALLIVRDTTGLALAYSLGRENWQACLRSLSAEVVMDDLINFGEPTGWACAA